MLVYSIRCESVCIEMYAFGFNLFEMCAFVCSMHVRHVCMHLYGSFRT